MIKLILLFIGLFVAISCSKSAKDNLILVEANQIHLEAVEIQEGIESKIKILDSLKNTIQDVSLKAQIDSTKTLFENWEESLIEVEGFEHEHHHDHAGHDHHHKPTPKMTDESMLEYQKNTKQAIEELSKEVDVLLNKIKQ